MIRVEKTVTAETQGWKCGWCIRGSTKWTMAGAEGIHRRVGDEAEVHREPKHVGRIV